MHLVFNHKRERKNKRSFCESNTLRLFPTLLAPKCMNPIVFINYEVKKQVNGRILLGLCSYGKYLL